MIYKFYIPQIYDYKLYVHIFLCLNLTLTPHIQFPYKSEHSGWNTK